MCVAWVAFRKTPPATSLLSEPTTPHVGQLPTPLHASSLGPRAGRAHSPAPPSAPPSAPPPTPKELNTRPKESQDEMGGCELWAVCQRASKRVFREASECMDPEIASIHSSAPSFLHCIHTTTSLDSSATSFDTRSASTHPYTVRPDPAPDGHRPFRTRIPCPSPMPEGRQATLDTPHSYLTLPPPTLPTRSA